MTTCAGCDEPLPPESPRPGPPRKWHSDECRRRAWDREHGRECACGAPIDAAKVRKGVVRCRACFLADSERLVLERAELIAVMWADGRSLNEIAATMGWPRNQLGREFDRIRRRWPGLLPYRNRTYGGKVRTTPATRSRS